VELPERGGGAAAGLVRGDQLRLVVGAADAKSQLPHKSVNLTNIKNKLTDLLGN